MSYREHRTFHNVEIRRKEELGPNGRPVISVQAIKPYGVDDYGSLWMPDTFDEDVLTRIAADPHDTPSLCWAHDWADPIGHGIGYAPSSDGPYVDFELDEFDAVPRAKQADAQTSSKTIRDCSVGFSSVKRRPPTEEEKQQYEGVKEVIEKADLDEVSLVLKGAVKGAKVLARVRSVRTATGMVDEELVVSLAKKVAAGEMTEDEAKVALGLATVEDNEETKTTTETEETSTEENPEGTGTEESTNGETESEVDKPITDAELNESVATALGN